MINLLHSLYTRLINKIKKTRKKNSWKSIPQINENVFFRNEFQLFDPHLVGTNKIGDESCSFETLNETLKVLQILEPEPVIDFVKEYIKKGISTHGHKWRYSDINSLLFSIGRDLKIENYLEVGVRRGRSMCVLASQSKDVNIFGFDLWIPDYVGIDNPGTQFVKNELKKVGHTGNVEFIDGDSKKTIPKFFRDNPNIFFDVITVDGDHSLVGASKDLRNVKDHLKIGGILVFDDISSQEHPYLKKVWEREIKSLDNFYTWEFSDLGLGIAFAIRKY